MVPALHGPWRDYLIRLVGAPTVAAKVAPDAR